MCSLIYGLVTKKEGFRMTRSADISQLVVQFPGTTEISPRGTPVRLRQKLLTAITVQKQIPSGFFMN